jgi:hypothetical protein
MIHEALPYSRAYIYGTHREPDCLGNRSARYLPHPPIEPFSAYRTIQDIDKDPYLTAPWEDSSFTLVWAGGCMQGLVLPVQFTILPFLEGSRPHLLVRFPNPISVYNQQFQCYLSRHICVCTYSTFGIRYLSPGILPPSVRPQ